MRILGIDCGTRITGYGIIETEPAPTLIEAGVIRSRESDPMEQRLLQIGRELRAHLTRLQPDAAAVEDVFTAVNSRSALKLAQVRGVALFTIAEAGLAAAAYSPAEVKSAITGTGRAEKAQIQFMVGSLLRLAVPPESEDACDALGVALCHAAHLRMPAVR